MAERRMFAKSIVLSDAFLDMPMSARCLYFTLGMLADDDGFIGSPKSIMRQCGASEDDMKVLIAKKFILNFETGVIVIKHWRMNNYLRNDRHNTTTYLEEYNTLGIDNKGAYTQNIEKMEQLPLGIPSVNQVVDERYTQDSIGKDSIGKNNKKDKEPKHKYGEYQHVLLTDKEQAKLVEEYGMNKAFEAVNFLDAYIEEKGYKAKSHYLSIRRWVMDALDKDKQAKGKQNKFIPSTDRGYTADFYKQLEEENKGW